MLIGLSGFAGSGKDEAARVLVRRGFTRVAFADNIRKVLYAMDPHIPLVNTESELHSIGNRAQYVEKLSYIVDDIGWDDAKNTYPEIRRLLQRMGTEGGREILGKNVWVESALADVEGDVVITDTRFQNEADYIKSRGGIVVKIIRQGVGPVNNHVSDNALDFYDFDVVIDNNGTIKDLHEEILMITGFMKEPV